MQEKKLLANIWKYTLFLITNKRVWTAVIAVYYLTIPGVNALGISYTMLAGNLAGFIFEIPSGYLADKVGHKNTIILSRILAIISSTLFLFAWDLNSIIWASVFFALSNAFFSGTGSAFMHDTLKALGKDEDYGKIMGKSKSLGFAVPLIIASTVPFFTTWGMQIPFLIGLIMDVLGLIIAFSFVSPKKQTSKINEISFSNFKSILVEGRKLGYLKYTVFSGVLGGLLYSISYFRGAYQEAAGAAVIWFGIFFGAGRIIASLLLWFTPWLQKLLNLKQFFFWQTAIFFLIFLILGLTSNPWVVVVLFALQNGIKWGLTEIEDSYILPIIKESNNKATLLSIGAQSEQLFGAILSPIIGWLIFTFSHQNGMLYISFLILILTVPLYILIFNKKHEQNIT